MQNILLIGNSSYRNRGCEAIVRGTIAILESKYGKNLSIEMGIFNSAADAEAQQVEERDLRVRAWSLKVKKYSCVWIRRQLNKRLRFRFFDQCSDLQRVLEKRPLVLQVGGDNYSLDYGVPRKFFHLDRTIWRTGCRSFLWGASVGPFSDDPNFEKEAVLHLAGFDGIFVRESLSANYLKSHGLGDNTYHIADPAFAMEPCAPAAGKEIPDKLEEFVGLNLSPIMWRYARGWTYSRWEEQTVLFVEQLCRKFPRILLVPHVTAPTLERCDAQFLARIALKLPSGMREQIVALPTHLSAAELKHCIARLPLFIGARTHSTIAAFSQGVPTVSIAYSVKAAGLNDDIFGHQDYVIPISEFEATRSASRIEDIWNRRDMVRSELEATVPRLKARAFAAADHLP